MKLINLFSLILTVVLVIITTKGLHAQEVTQSLKGRIIDQQSKSPIIGANVIIVDSKPLKGASTDVDGYYKITNVPLGRVIIKISSAGFQEQTIPNVLLTSGKETIVDLEIQEKITDLQEVVVTTVSQRTSIDKGLVSVSSKTFDIEETQRFAGSRNDPARMVSGFAGVTSNNDSRNDIIIRGNSPTGLLWRVEGMDIPNPSHFGALGATGGPVSMLNNNLLAKSAFLTGAFPAIYGNATAGIFDLQLRNGNSEKREYTAQLGFNGFEFGAEGYFSKSSRASYLIHYRRSFLGVLQAIGIDFGTGKAVPSYQDLAFKINVPTQNLGTFTLWGIGGNSKIGFNDDKSVYNDDGERTDYKTGMGVVGISNMYFFNKNLSGKLSLTASNAFENNLTDEVVDKLSVVKTFTPLAHSNSSQSRVSLNYLLNYKINAKNTVTAGFYYNVLSMNYADSAKDANVYRQIRVFDGSTTHIQGYGNWLYRPTDKLAFNLGVFYQQLLLNKSMSIEPRFGVKYQLNEKQSLSFALGRHSQLQNLQVYFNTKPTQDLTIAPNRNLGMTLSDHLVLGYERSIGAKTRFKLETYYQSLSNIPVEKTPSDYSILNAGTGFSAPKRNDLVNAGTGRNYGLEMSVERNFSNGYYFLTTISLYDSRYKGSNGVEHNTAFNGQYTFNLLAGKEFKLGKKYTLALDTKVTLAGGRRYTPINLEQSIKEKETVLETSKAFERQFDGYNRTDFKITFRKNGQRATQEWFIDFQNMLNTENVFNQSYDSKKEKIVTNYQLGFFPSFSYRLQF
jgi:hypothetical protein